MSARGEEETVRTTRRRGGGISLMVMGDRFTSTHPLPSSGTVVLGRGERADVRIDDASVSRLHAAIHITGEALAIEDTGSCNGTRLGDRELTAGERTPVSAGDTVELGAVMVLIRPGAIEEETLECESVTARGERVVVDDPAMKELYQLVDRIASSPISVLLLGETGVGKEVIAERIHLRSDRASAPLLRLNCAALSETLLEAELFGYERGAFTGAATAKPGLLETADHGTVFLDEIGDLPSSLQAKLLRVLEDQQVLRVGSLKTRPIDVRIIAATHRDLEQDVESGRFRRDLYFRLNGISIQIPPLRERRAEIAPLVRTFAARAAQQGGLLAPPRLSDNALELLESYTWPGNVRELRNIVTRAVLLCEGDEIRAQHLPLDKMRPARTAGAETIPPPAAAPADLRAGVDEAEKQMIVDALRRARGNQTRAAKLLGIARSTLVKRIEKYDLPRPRKDED